MPVNLKRYTLVYLAAIAGLVVLSILLTFLFGISLPSGVSTVLPTFLAAMFEGQKSADAGAEPYTGSQAWGEARRMTGVVLVINAVFFLVFFLLPDVRALILAMPVIIAIILVLAFGIVFVVNRFALTLGYNTRQKAKNAKGS